ncbi:MAG TPA: Bax inhibitor-1/YccA family protein [Syntrophobacter fumaroxidans]|nr:Bax inhibitor-1/YccA family protein [Syntrophobacter fumaroxidans]
MERQYYPQQDQVVAIQSDFVRRVYNWMGIGLATTAVVAMLTFSSSTTSRLLAQYPGLMLGLVLAELGLVIAISAGINRFRASSATLMFFIYSALNGVTLSVIFLVYAHSSIANTFFVTAGMFAIMSVYGYTTRTDLTSWGNFLFMGLIGIILASVVNIFLGSQSLDWIISCLGVIIFVGLTAYDTQSIKAMAHGGFADAETEQKAAVIGALRLYLDFINLFLMLLRLFGRRD